jgi:hypothetical protein
VNPSQEPARPRQQASPPVDPTADPSVYRPPAAAPPAGEPVLGAPAGNGVGTFDGGGGYGLAHPSEPGGEVPYWQLPGGYPGDGAAGVPPAARRRPWRRTAWVSVLVGLVIVALGAPLGLLWAWVAPSVPVNGDGIVTDPSPEQFIAAEGWFALLGLGFGLLVAVAAWLAVRRDRGPFLLLGVVAGALGAGWLVAPWVGEMIGRDAYQQWQKTAAHGATYLAPPEVHSLGPMLVPAFAAAITLTLLAGWSNDPDLDGPDSPTAPSAG